MPRKTNSNLCRLVIVIPDLTTGRTAEGWLATRGQNYGSVARVAKNFVKNLRKGPRQ